MSECQRRAGDVFDDALALADEQRAAFLEKACAGDMALRRRVESLLRAHAAAGVFMEKPLSATVLKTQILPPTEQPGDRIGRYKLQQQIGEGGCGVVYMAEQAEPVRRQVALKVIKLGMDTKEVIARFEVERQALAMMDHPNIAKVFDAGATEAGRPYFVMELVRGIKITDYCDKNNLSTRERLELFIQVCQAVQHAHQKGIIHRDIKPSNILVTLRDGAPTPKVIDFGVAKATTNQRLTDKTLFTAFEQFIGTPAYMSPEQAEMNEFGIDTRSDIYSLGILLYELLTGTTPFDARELMSSGLDAMRQTIRQKEPVRPSTRLSTMVEGELTTTARQRQTEALKLIHAIRGDLDWIVMKALEKDRTRRYETANGLAADIGRHLKSEPIMARPPSASYRFQKMVQRNKLACGAVGAVAATLILGIIASTREALRATRAEQQQSRLRTEAETEAQRAKNAATEARLTLAASDFLEAARLIEANDGSAAVPYLARILSADPDNSAALTRLAALMTYHSWLIPTLSLEHGDIVCSAQFSPDGKRIVTASWDQTARVWDAGTGQPLTAPLKHEQRVISAEFSPDGRRIVTASSDNTARVWDAQTGQPLTEPLKHEREVTSAQFSPDGKRIVTASADNTARVWDAQTGQPLAKPLKHAGGVSFAQFSPEGKRIVTASEDNTARVWDAQTGQPLTEPLQHGREVTSARFSPDGRRIVTASSDNTARVWDAQTGQPLTESLLHGRAVNSARFSPDGQRIVTASQDSTARVWDGQTGQPLTEPLKHGSLVHSAQFSPDGRRIVTASADGSTRVWDAQTGQPLTESFKQGSPVFSAQFSPDGERILTSSQDNAARVWEAQTGPPLAESLTHGREVQCAQFSPDGKRIVTSSLDNTAQVWDAQTGQPLLKPLQHEGPVCCVQFSPDGRRVATASWDHTARVWDAQTGQPLTPPLRHEDRVYCARFSPDGRRIVTASRDGSCRVWDAQTGQPVTKPLKHRQGVNFARFSPDGRRIVSASWDNTAQIWDAQTGQPVTKPLTHGNDVFCAEFSPDGKRIVTASADNTARVWDVKTGQPLTEPMKHQGPVYTAQFSPDGRRIVTAAQDSTARVWDAETGQPLTEPLKHEGLVYSAQFSPDGKRIVTASEDTAARVWDAQTGQPLTEPLKYGKRVNSTVLKMVERALFVVNHWDRANGVDCVEFSPDGKRIVLAFEDTAARVWDVDLAPSRRTDWLLPLAEAFSGTRLNKQGVLELTSLDRAKTTAQMRQELKAQPDNGDGVMWGRWLLANRSTRLTSPFSSMTVPQYIDRKINEGTPESLEEAAQLAVGDGELLQRVLAKRASLEQTASLQSEAQELADQARLAEAEARYREALRSNRNNWPTQFVKWQSSIDGLIAVLKREGKFGDPEKIFHDLLAEDSATPSPSAIFLRDRGVFLARRGQWKEAAADLSKVVDLYPTNPWLHHLLVPLLVQSRDVEGYRRHRAQALALFGRTDDPVVAERMAKICLILPASGMDLDGASRLADTAVTVGRGNTFFPYFALTKGLAEYRQGYFASAAEWALKALVNPGQDHNRAAQAYFVLAMAQYQSKKQDDSLTALTQGTIIMETQMPRLESGDLGDTWHDWVISDVLFKEAQALIEPAQTRDK